MSRLQDSNQRKAVQRREVFTAWILLSIPILGFGAYLMTALGLQIGAYNAPLIVALLMSVACLLALSWTFIHHTQADWVKTTRFIAAGLIFEGLVLGIARASSHDFSVYFGIASVVLGLILLPFAKKN